ncbi:MAG: indole-3-glycerol phosphate synthase TrpC [Crocinitomicaceae bacterium]|nr:indole-3-glycerol phosphate synthase TrpC [Crocinitomicaceae bacterium]
MTTLDHIIAHKKQEVDLRKTLYPVKLLETSVYFNTDAVSLKKYLLRSDKSGIIAEYKKQSPSAGVINQYADIEKISIGYMQAGASALSVLTDKKYFGGSNEDLTQARKFNYCPILRKDFVIDKYQILEAKSIGADAVLLIASVLSHDEIEKLIQFAHELKLEVLLEIHDEAEIEKIHHNADVIGINNRNLKNMTTDIQHSISLIKKIPDEFVIISESGIARPEDALKLREAGFHGFLIGTEFMMHARPHEACRDFIHTYNQLLQS